MKQTRQYKTETTKIYVVTLAAAAATRSRSKWINRIYHRF